jgi:hypothetical protein
VGFLIVFLVAAVVGIAVYAQTLREQLTSISAEANDGDAATVETTDVAPDGWQDRVVGFARLVVVISVAAIGVAAFLWIAVSELVRLIKELIPNGIGFGVG